VLMSTVRAFGRYAIVTPIFSWASKASDGGPAGEKASFTASYFHMGKTKVTELVVMRSRCRIWCSLLSVLRLNSLREHHPCCNLAGRSNPGMPSLLLYPVPRGNLTVSTPSVPPVHEHKTSTYPLHDLQALSTSRAHVKAGVWTVPFGRFSVPCRGLQTKYSTAGSFDQAFF
jgi:hypothetical protein